MRTLAIINPVAGGGRGFRAWRQLGGELRGAGLRIDEALADRPMQAWALAEHAEGYELVIAVGGDGTIHETVNGLLARPSPRPALGIVPGGTANILARGLGLPRDPFDAARLLARGGRRRVDVGRVNDRYFLSVAGVGFDGEVAAAVNRRRGRLPSPPLFAAAILAHLVAFRPFPARLEIDGNARDTTLYFVTAANTPWYGGGMHIAPHARADSGRLAVVYAGALSRWEALRVLLATFSGGHLDHPKVAHTLAQEVRVETRAPVAVQADGESIGHSPVTFRIVPAALDVIAPPA